MVKQLLAIDTIHSDGTVETLNRWQPGGARGNKDQLFCDGDHLLFAVRCCHSPQVKERYTSPEREREWWDIRAVTVHCDSETPLTFDGDFGWSWEDVEWFLHVSEIDLPVGDEP